jgi:L-aspartate oxidase
MERTRAPTVFLDLTHLEPNFIRARFPGIAATCTEFGLDITRDWIPVRPGAHYLVGGISVDLEGRTSVPGLWAAGECTSSGLHGANRLASNSLLEGLVYGAHAGEQAAEVAATMEDELRALPISNPAAEEGTESLDLWDIRNSLKSLMGRYAGVRREQQELIDAAETIDRWCRYVLPRQFSDAEGWELQNMLVVSRLVVAAALQREETRGVHYRTDFPQTDDVHWKRRIAFQRTGGN